MNLLRISCPFANRRACTLLNVKQLSTQIKHFSRLLEAKLAEKEPGLYVRCFGGRKKIFAYSERMAIHPTLCYFYAFEQIHTTDRHTESSPCLPLQSEVSWQNLFSPSSSPLLIRSNIEKNV